MQPDFILAQISDTHIKKDGKLAYQKVDTRAALKRAIARLNNFSPRGDAVLISGDLLDFGLEEECEELRSLLTQLNSPYYLVPGNHDLRAPLRKIFPEQPFPAEGPLNWTAEFEQLRLIGLDDVVEYQPHGEFTADTLDYLEEQLQASNKPTIISFHHPPVQVGIDHMDVQNLRNHQDAADIIGRHSHVLAVLCGHMHRYVVSRWANTQLIICPGVSHSVTLDLHKAAQPSFTLEPPMLLLHCLYGQNLLTHCLPIGEFDGPYPFFNADGSLIDD